MKEVWFPHIPIYTWVCKEMEVFATLREIPLGLTGSCKRELHQALRGQLRHLYNFLLQASQGCDRSVSIVFFHLLRPRELRSYCTGDMSVWAVSGEVQSNQRSLTHPQSVQTSCIPKRKPAQFTGNPKRERQFKATWWTSLPVKLSPEAKPWRPMQVEVLATGAARSLLVPLSPTQASKVAEGSLQPCYIPDWPDSSLEMTTVQ